MGLEPWTLLAVVAAIVLISGFVQSAIGFGYGITGLAMLPLFMEARDSHILISLSGMPVLIVTAWVWRHETDWKLVRITLLGAVCFLPLGIWLFRAMSLDLLVRTTGASIIVMVLLSLKKKPKSGATPSSKMGFFAGALSGFMAGSVSIGGPPIATFAMLQHWPPKKFKGFVVHCLLLIGCFRMIGLAMAGLITERILLQATWAVPFAIVGAGLGMMATRRIDPNRFRRGVAFVLILVACQLLYHGSPSERKETKSDTRSFDNGLPSMLMGDSLDESHGNHW